ncbi:MAG: CoB--CoM heterodisulfide reductase iron-sulfur subunit B family protein [Candidatus Bathyarchaeota archaeon]|nr:CoB--CoM heterodisulfide reductase iron-sulfur subunit B family protein [Candidatus Bathyarchaeota archaeon]
MAELEYLFFLGCLIPYRLSSYEVSARKVLGELGVKLVEMPDFNCCGFPMAPVDYDLALSLAACDLSLAEKENLNILTLCNGCFGTLNDVNKTLKENKTLKDRVNGYLQQIGMEFKGTITVKHLVHALTEDIGQEKLKEFVKNPLTGLRVAQHTGCHLIRPAKHVGHGDNPEDPKALKNLIGLTGAVCLDYMDETECCGNTVIGVNEEVPFEIAKEKLEHVRAVGAQVLVTVCPSCHMMYDFNQPRIERAFNVKFGVPVLHYTQLLGLAMGFAPEELGLTDHRVKPTQLLSQIREKDR